MKKKDARKLLVRSYLRADRTLSLEKANEFVDFDFKRLKEDKKMRKK